MYKLTTLKNGLTLITIDLPHLESVTSLVAVGAGSRYENKENNGVSHFLEHMFFKGSKKYPSAQLISTIVDGMGAVNNAGTDKEYTFYWIKSSAKNLEKSTDILSSMFKESLFDPGEIEKEKGVIIEEIRMYQDNPQSYVWELYEKLQYGDQPLGWDVAGEEDIIQKVTKKDFLKYQESLYVPSNMALVFAGRLPSDINKLAQNYFSDLVDKDYPKFVSFKKNNQISPRVNVFYKQTDQANLVLGVESFGRYDPKRYAARLLAIILGEGMSSRLFQEIRVKRGLAYSVGAHLNVNIDTGFLTAYGGLKKDKIDQAIKIFLEEFEKFTKEKVTDEELQKAKEMERGRLALRSESTNFLAEYHGLRYVIDKKIETFDEYLKKIDKVTSEDIQSVAKDLLQKNKYNLQIIGPFKDSAKFSKLLS